MQSCVLCFDFCLLKTHKKATRRSRQSARKYAQLNKATSKFTASSQASLPTQLKLRWGGGGGSGGGVIQGKYRWFEEEVRAGYFIRMRK